MSAPTTLVEWMVDHIQSHGQPPTASQIRTAADFRQAGGIERLCSALETLGVLMAKSRQGRAA